MSNTISDDTPTESHLPEELNSTVSVKTLGDMINIFSPRPFKSNSEKPVVSSVQSPVQTFVSGKNQSEFGSLEEELIELYKAPDFNYNSDSSTSIIHLNDGNKDKNGLKETSLAKDAEIISGELITKTKINEEEPNATVPAKVTLDIQK